MSKAQEVLAMLEANAAPRLKRKKLAKLQAVFNVHQAANDDPENEVEVVRTMEDELKYQRMATMEFVSNVICCDPEGKDPFTWELIRRHNDIEWIDFISAHWNDKWLDEAMGELDEARANRTPLQALTDDLTAIWSNHADEVLNGFAPSGDAHEIELEQWWEANSGYCAFNEEEWFSNELLMRWSA